MATPTDGWIVNSAMSTIPVQINGYTKAGLQEVHIEYKLEGTTTWINALVVPASSLLPNDPNGANLGTTVQLDAANIPDGNYALRLRSICTSGISNFSMRRVGIKDTKAPEIFGLPAPIDDIYETGDMIGAEFDEVVKAVNLSNATGELIRLDNGDGTQGAGLRPSTFSLFENRASIVPQELLAQLTPGAYRVVLRDIEDIYGNVAQPISWVFITPGYVIDALTCSLLNISNNNDNQNAINVSNYLGTSIISDGSVVGAGNTNFLASNDIELQPNFEVQQGGNFIATIYECTNGDPCGDVTSTTGQVIAPTGSLRWDIREGLNCVTGIHLDDSVPANADVKVDVTNFVGTGNTSVNVNVTVGTFTISNFNLTSAGATLNMGTYQSSGGNTYNVEIRLDFVDGSNNDKIVVATVRMMAQSAF